ncbi:hypothetical protein TNCT_437161 [Trichonephila clavata]|uniref:Uncharacterized protein n=1 Tax=Trichonephila clavata TaxID=2740835 RepID=A0A8X6LHZ2_TRICU|nr:hypothetical protein TNCT_437161 [Trichonephila clavata]
MTERTSVRPLIGVTIRMMQQLISFSKRLTTDIIIEMKWRVGWNSFLSHECSSKRFTAVSACKARSQRRNKFEIPFGFCGCVSARLTKLREIFNRWEDIDFCHFALVITEEILEITLF